MTKPIVQSATFKAPPEELFALFTDSKKHSAATGAKATVSVKAGAKWIAFGGMLLGKNLAVVPGKGAMAVFAPPLDGAGNSVKAQETIAFVAEQLGINLFSPSSVGFD